MLELELAREVAAEHRPESPQHRGGGRLGDHDGALRRRVERLRLVDEPEAEERRQEEPGKARPRPLAEQRRRGRDGDERLHLLDHDWGDVVGVTDQRVGEEDRGQSRRAGADDDGRRHVASACAEDGTERGEEERECEQDEDHVLAEDDRRRRRRAAHRLADDRVRPPHRRGDRDEDDAGNRCEATHRAEATDRRVA